MGVLMARERDDGPLWIPRPGDLVRLRRRVRLHRQRWQPRYLPDAQTRGKIVRIWHGVGGIYATVRWIVGGKPVLLCELPDELKEAR